MFANTITAVDVQKKLQQGAVLVDIRNPDEYRREHIKAAILQPLDQINEHGLPTTLQQAECLIFHCKSGMRTRNAAENLARAAAGKEVWVLENGLDGWKSSGLPIEKDRSQPLEMMRQVQIVAGSLILLGALLGWAVSPSFYLLCAFVGAGLLTAGLTGFCGMARLLALMPWNRRAQ
ncbi:rhodanese family protein [Neisseria montereyensis]|uniref:Rhodanese family protein n=1 Tax=Neisseria montereyensis TaxID=2973938 RepID=A0ABT2FEW2_9NEIS|nr:rhodanese family protein [Neisseria montereyensis]MCS4534670.1 rhodanese family protein [Neisseria montereyensis]